MSGATTAVAIAVTVISTAVSMYAQHEQQRAQEKSAKSAAEYNSEVAGNEAAMQQQLAQNEISKGIADRERQQRAAVRSMGEMRAGMGASGFQMDSGTMVSLLGESAEEHQHDSNIITSNAAQAAWQHQISGTNSLNNQAFAQYQGNNANGGRLGSYLGLGGSLLGGIGAGVGQLDAWGQSSKPSQSNSGWTYENPPPSGFGGNSVWWNTKGKK